MTTAEAVAIEAPGRGSAVRKWLWAAGKLLLQLGCIYLVLLAIHAYLGWWSPEYLEGRSLWHFWFSRMIVPMVMLGFFAAFASGPIATSEPTDASTTIHRRAITKSSIAT